MLKRPFYQVWEQLRGKRPHLADFLEELRIQGLRGIRDLQVRLSYPVSVLAGPNGSGKSTVLFALACAYRVPGSGVRDFVPSTMFPDFRSREETTSDPAGPATFEYYYVHQGRPHRMRWARGRGWNRSFLGLKGGLQPERPVYLRTTTVLANPAELRGAPQLGRDWFTQQELSADLLVFAHRVLEQRYRRLHLMARRTRDLLFAEREDSGGPRYSEFHMSAGERGVLRLSKDLSQLRSALVLIDEVEASLHPLTQQQLMLELQRLALRNDLQIVVTTHSPTVLETVPIEGRIFLERTEDDVVVRPPYRDVLQKALYGSSVDKLSILCEDEVAEALLRGVLDFLNPVLDLSPSDLEVGRDTGKDEFPHHVRALAKFRQLDGFLFILDGDAQPQEAAVRQAAQDFGQPIRLLFLPGAAGPERWVWDRLARHPAEYAAAVGLEASSFERSMQDLDRTFSGAADSPARIAKGRLTALAEETARDVGQVCRLVGRTEAARDSGGMAAFVRQLREAIEGWRSIHW